MGLLDWLSNGNNQKLEDNNMQNKFSIEKYLVNECNSGRENLRDDYPDFYDKLKTEMGESRFNDDIIYNSEIKSVRKVWLKNSKYLDNLKE